MPASVFLIWPALHMMYGVSQFRTNKIPSWRFIPGLILLLLSAAISFIPKGLELGAFYWLFTGMACAILFTQIRIWWPKIVIVLTLLSLAGGAYVSVI